MLKRLNLGFLRDKCEFNVVRDSLSEKRFILEFNLDAATENTNIFLNFSCCDVFFELVTVTFIGPRTFRFL